MPRFYIAPKHWNVERLVLDEAESHHALSVLRMGPGDRATAFNGVGEQAEVEIAVASKRAVQLRTLSLQKKEPLPCRITLAQAVPKGKNMELIIQKATELGAAQVVPLLTERTVVQLEGGDSGRKQEKWQSIAVEACKQCGQNWLPEVSRPIGIREYFGANPEFDLRLIASLQPDTRHLKTVLATFHAAHGRAPRSALILIGPEGDFTPGEIDLARKHGCQPITLGPIVLRTETAALYCLSVLSYELLL